MIDDETIELATTLAARCRKQRDKFAIACHRILYRSQQIREDHKLHADAAYSVISAFQVIQATSFIHENKYISKEQIGIFGAALIIALQGTPTKEWMQHAEQYELNNQKPILEQLRWFCEDVAMAIVGSKAGMIYSLAFASMAIDFFYRTWCIVADHFGDKATEEKYGEIVKAIHKGREGAY
jgi:hypothetical protein